MVSVMVSYLRLWYHIYGYGIISTVPYEQQKIYRQIILFQKICLLKHEMALSTDGTESVCGENAFTPLLFSLYFILFIHSAILHSQFTHTIHLVYYSLLSFCVYFTTPSMC